MNLLCIDPGTYESAYVLYETNTKRIEDFGKVKNEYLVTLIQVASFDRLVIEMIKSYGNIMGDSTIQTCVWIGRFIQTWGDRPVDLIPRKTIVTALCNNPRAKDSNVRAALIDLYSTPSEPAIGKKKTPGPLYGFSKDMWAALSIAVTWEEITQSILN